MVFEQLFAPRWLEKKPNIIFLLAFVYSEIGILSALWILPQNVDIGSLAFTSLLLLPSLNSLLGLEESIEIKERSLSLIRLFKDHWEILRIYFFMFLGVLLSYAFFALVLNDFTTHHLFRSQIGVLGYSGNAAGEAASLSGEFWSILFNNIGVMVIAFLFSFMYGAGSIFFLTWNASVWGTIFGYFAKESAHYADLNPFMHFGHLFITVFPHMITEAGAYFLVAIAGGVISKAAIKEKPFSRNFNHVMKDAVFFFFLAIFLLVIAAWLEVYLFPGINPLFRIK
ncbi:stage II sporulation protein M [Candidatus Woesearchaeota archaeon]|nr:stage II sporulation protein M [Candidatus Woesearchaeota archaeon]